MNNLWIHHEEEYNKKNFFDIINVTHLIIDRLWTVHSGHCHLFSAGHHGHGFGCLFAAGGLCLKICRSENLYLLFGIAFLWKLKYFNIIHNFDSPFNFFFNLKFNLWNLIAYNCG